MDKCADAGPINDSSNSCNIANLVPEKISGVLEKLPGKNSPTGWGQGESASSSSYDPESTSITTSILSASQALSTTRTPVYTTDNSVIGWSYLGCYSDNKSTRALTGIQFADLGIDNVTSTGCMEYCGNAGFSLAGTEYAGQCFCGNKMKGSSKIAANECDMNCEGDASQICGGSLALSVFEKATKTASKRSRRHFLQHVHGKHV
ncbi:hypothetical protein N7490_009304 [Penicillium lividum]|nr:hypothetical protein N7490_009304 [Penicillium lividum]